MGYNGPHWAVLAGSGKHRRFNLQRRERERYAEFQFEAHPCAMLHCHPTVAVGAGEVEEISGTNFRQNAHNAICFPVVGMMFMIVMLCLYNYINIRLVILQNINAVLKSKRLF